MSKYVSKAYGKYTSGQTCELNALEPMKFEDVHNEAAIQRDKPKLCPRERNWHRKIFQYGLVEVVR